MSRLLRRTLVWRRKRCMRLGHPKATWSPVALTYMSPTGDRLEMFAYRCAWHDHPPMEFSP